jgi:nucleoside-diphosphate-sugar epimerase
MEKEHILITGATGFIGSHVIDKLLSEKTYKIVAIVRNINNYKNVETLKQNGVILIKGCFYDKDTVENVFNRFPVSHVIHVAALRGAGAGNNKDYFTVNVKGTEVLLQSSFEHNIKKFLFLSSVGVFGTIPEDLPANLNSRLVGDNKYHNSKILAEQKVKLYTKKGLDAYIVRPTITYGPGDDGFPTTLINMVKGRTFICPAKDIKIHLLDVFSLADLLSRIIKLNNLYQRVFIAADEVPVSLGELVDLIYFHFYNKKYPSLLKLPNILFRMLSNVFILLRNEKWLTRILLISKNWNYDISETTKAIQYVPAKTADSFLKHMNI